MLKVAFLCGKTSFKIPKHSPFSTFIYRILQFVSNENKCLLISRFKVYAIFANGKSIVARDIVLHCMGASAAAPNPTATLADWLANGDDCEVHLCAESQSGEDRKKKEKAAAEKRPLDSHKAPGLSPGSWSKRCTPSALQAVKQQQQRQPMP